ncbi:hypothetical protein [Moorella sulfitireducens]
MRGIFETVLLRTGDWAVVLGLSLVPLVAVEISKLLGKLKLAEGRL